jgi:predicted DNA-binding WGR domain protein
MYNREYFYFENKKGNSNKFWAAEIILKKGKIYLVRRYGKIGQEGKTMIEEFTSRRTAERRRENLIEEKINKGYRGIM